MSNKGYAGSDMTEKFKILVVDDEQVILDSARKLLGSERFRLVTALDAESALQILEAEAQDIMISDLVLPGASGMELLETACEKDPTLLTVITTGYSTVENAVTSLKKGAFDYLPKPFTYEELQSCVDRACRAIALRLTLKARISVARDRGSFHLGLQTWARLEPEGSALMGVTEFHLRTIEPIERIEFPGDDAELQQGGRLVCLNTTDGMAHNVWSPLGGRVLDCNDRLRDQPEFLREDPSGAGWIVRILPFDPKGELANLIGP
ncbi:MAG: response regulator [Acidobacteriota bacterium]